MLFERLTLCDVGVFRGPHSFELLPRTKQGAKRPVVLFGGLNGAGKTTILTSIRLALFGRQALGVIASQKAYQQFIRELIHRGALVPAEAASVALEFTYSKLGTPSRYRITRSWSERGRQLQEELRIERDGAPIEQLTPEQAQELLSQLIPPGVAQFFFFDGEKIAELAADETDTSLPESIRRLLGLNVVERLRADLTVLARQHRIGKADDASRTEISEGERNLERLRVEIEQGYAKLHEEVDSELEGAQRELAHLENELGERGGAWASSRDGLKGRLDELLRQKAACEERVRELLSGPFPLALAPSLTGVFRDVVMAGRDGRHARAHGAWIVERLPLVEARLKSEVPEIEVERILSVLSDVYALSSSMGTAPPEALWGNADESERLLGVFNHVVPAAKSEMLRALSELRACQDSLESIGERLAQAPSEASLQDLFERLKTASQRIGELRARRASMIEQLRRALWQSVMLVRELRKVEREISQATADALVVERAEGVRGLLEEFVDRLTERKLHVLRQHFLQAFVRLARKEDLIVDAIIDPKDFSVALIDRRGTRIPKQRLSAGEKQIYAIAMLEALARTSGRNIPVVIDTPLGRLDSQHRTRLVENYFPTASHQVIILSTDTEVDEPFYQGLSRHVSHAYHLEFDSNEGATRTAEGYFWRVQTEGRLHAA